MLPSVCSLVVVVLHLVHVGNMGHVVFVGENYRPSGGGFVVVALGVVCVGCGFKVRGVLSLHFETHGTWFGSNGISPGGAAESHGSIGRPPGGGFGGPPGGGGSGPPPPPANCGAFLLK